MKTTFINIICFVAVAFGLQSCYTDFDPKLQTDPVLCMNSVLETECPIKVSLSHSYTWVGIETIQDYLNPSYNDVSVKDAEVSLYINGVLKDVMTFSTKSIDSSSEIKEYGYFSDYCPAAGDEVRLVAVSKEYGVAEATVVMPKKVEIEDIDVTTVSSKKLVSSFSTTFNINQNFSVWFTDPAADVNYYRILVEPINPEPIPTGKWHEIWWSEEMFETKYASSLSFWNINNESEPLFSEHADVLDIMFDTTSSYFTLFSDKSIQGKRYPISLRLENANLNIYNPENIESLYDVRLRFKFYNVSESYYNWFIYSWYNEYSIQGSLTEIGFAEALVPPSNVSTNAGVVAAFTKSTFDISYQYFLKENYIPSENEKP